MAQIGPGEQWIQTIELPQARFQADDPGVAHVSGYTMLGPGRAASGLPTFPAGAYKANVLIRFPMNAAPTPAANNPARGPLWKGNSIESSPVEILLTEP
jgi:hypothetical protein